MQWRSIGPALLFGSLWNATGRANILRTALSGRRFGFNVERAVFASVLHRGHGLGLGPPGLPVDAGPGDPRNRGAGTASGLPCDGPGSGPRWRARRRPRGSSLHAAPGTGSTRSCSSSAGTSTPISTECSSTPPRSTSTARAGPNSAGTAKARDFRPKCKQLVVGIVLDGDGGARRLGGPAGEHRKRQGPGPGCHATAGALRASFHPRHRGPRHDQPGERCVGRSARLALHSRREAPQSTEIKEKVLTDPGPYETVEIPRAKRRPAANRSEGSPGEGCRSRRTGKMPATTRRRVPVATWSAAIRPRHARMPRPARATLKKLHTRRERDGPTGLVGNRGFKRYLRARGDVFAVDYDKIQSEARFDGLWVLQTNTGFNPREIAARYKALWIVEQCFRSSTTLLDTRSIFQRPRLLLLPRPSPAKRTPSPHAGRRHRGRVGRHLPRPQRTYRNRDRAGRKTLPRTQRNPGKHRSNLSLGRCPAAADHSPDRIGRTRECAPRDHLIPSPLQYRRTDPVNQSVVPETQTVLVTPCHNSASKSKV